jgi:serine O-acetyltransferase
MVYTLEPIVTELLALRRATAAAAVPSPHGVTTFIEAALGLLFPHFSQPGATPTHTPSGASAEGAAPLTEQLHHCAQRLAQVCAPVVATSVDLTALTQEFLGALPHFHAVLREDAEAIYRGDPAAASVDEVIVAYPGFLAIAVYRLAHWLRQRAIPIVPRLMTEYAHRLTGVDIHPGAQIGRAFVIDHGTGIVIGETCVIEDNVKIYQGVTLGALSVEKSMADTKRHPTIERDVVLYANATILGGSTVVGRGSIIGGNVWLTSSVAPNSRVYHRADVTVRVSE